jgi:hypothetical protein
MKEAPWNYRVAFRGTLTPEAEEALDAAGLVYRAGHGGGVTAAGGSLPEITDHRIYLKADNREEALGKVQQVLEGHGTFTAFKAEPAPVDDSHD